MTDDLSALPAVHGGVIEKEAAWKTLSEATAFRSLVDALRSDNTLLALDVAHREIHWTRFLAWLFDPKRGSRWGTKPLELLLRQVRSQLDDTFQVAGSGEEEFGIAGVTHLRNFAAVPERSSIVVKEVQAEVSEGRAGRSDLVVQCDLGETPVTVLIENKIYAPESPGQLRGYVEQRLKDGSSGILLPLVLCLGATELEAPVSCSWATVLGREEIAAWLRALVADLGAACPQVCRDYLQILKVREDVEVLQRRYRKELEALHRIDREMTGTSYADWQLSKLWLVVEDRAFFTELVDHLQGLCRGFNKPGYFGSVLGRNEGLEWWKPEWELHAVGAAGALGRLIVHFEWQCRTVTRVHVEIDPYVSGLNKNEVERRRLQPLLQVKAAVIEVLRARLQDPSLYLATEIAADLRNCRNPQDAATWCAIKFRQKAPASSQSEAPLGFFAEVVRAVIPVIDQVIGELIASGTVYVSNDPAIAAR